MYRLYTQRQREFRLSWAESQVVRNGTERSTGGGLFGVGRLVSLCWAHGPVVVSVRKSSHRWGRKTRLEQQVSMWRCCRQTQMSTPSSAASQSAARVCVRGTSSFKRKKGNEIARVVVKLLPINQLLVWGNWRIQWGKICNHPFTWRRSLPLSLSLCFSHACAVVLCIVIIAVISNNEKQCVFKGWGRSGRREQDRKRGKEQPAVEHQREEKREWLSTKRERMSLTGSNWTRGR